MTASVKRYRYLTITYCCTKCPWTVRVVTRVPKDKEHHALNYSQAIDSKHCFRCQQIESVERCKCGSCTLVGIQKFPK